MLKKLKICYPTILFLICGIISCNLQGEDMALKLKNLNFDQDTKYWNVPDDFKIIPGAGRNGTKALYVKRDSVPPRGQTVKPVTRIVKFEHGKNYKISAWIRANIHQRGQYRTAGSFSLHFYDKSGQVIHNIYPIGIMESCDWSQVEKVFTMYPDSEYCEIRLDLFHGYLGEIWFDSLQIEEYDKNCVYAIAPVPLVLDEAQPTLLAGALNTCGNLPENLTIQGTLITEKSPGAATSAKVVSGMAKLTFPPQKSGFYRLKLELLNAENKCLDSVDVTVKISRQTPKVQVGLDRVLRVDGKKFMVLGMYMGQCPDHELAMVQQAGFNTVMPYGSLSLNENYRFDGKGRETPRDYYTGDANNSIAAITKVLDNMHKRDIKVIFSLMNLYDHALERFNLQTWQGVSGADNIARKAMLAVKDHPAALAWYICDEMPASQRDMITKRREDILRTDGDHPTWSVTMHFTEMHHFLNTTDIMGTDPYPLSNAQSDLTPLEFAGRFAKRLNMPHFLVGQCFSWAYYQPVEQLADPENWKKFRIPTEAEMRSMCLSHALDGATGFIYYYFPCISNPNIPIPGYLEKSLAALKAVNTALKKIEPWILSGNEIKMLDIQVTRGRVRAGEFTDEKGRRCVVIVGGALGNAAGFKLTGEFDSMFGLSKKVNNQWSFACEGINSDILIERIKK